MKPAVLDLTNGAAHYAVSCLFEEYSHESSIFSYVAVQDDYESFQEGRARLAVGGPHSFLPLHWNHAYMTFGVLHIGGP